MREQHGMRHTKLYYVWRMMRERCRSPKSTRWKWYGARGIRVCPEWDTSFSQFFSDMAPTYRPGLSIDRIDNNRGYGPGNCRWATPRQQGANRRTNVMVETNRGRLCLAEIGRRLGIPYTTVRRRYERGDVFVVPPPRLLH
jgi:hypothetical protein